MNRGAEEAGGKILLFLHVDCLIPKDSLNMIETRILNAGVVGGAFKQVFSNQDLFLRIVSVFGNLRSRLTSTFFGDYGIFLMKDVFRKIGGYDNVLFLEDVELCRKARQYGKLTQIDHYIFTSSRKYLREGRVRLTMIFIVVCLLNLLKCRPRFFVRYMA
jgi:GT2 family glycosyltransferase